MSIRLGPIFLKQHGYLSASRYRGMQVRASKMNGNLLHGRASILRCSAKCSASVLRHRLRSNCSPASDLHIFLVMFSAKSGPPCTTFCSQNCIGVSNMFIHSPARIASDLVTCSSSCCALSAKRRPPGEPSHCSYSEICILIVHHIW